MLVTAIGCAARLPALPTGPGEPLPDAQAQLDTLTKACRGVRTLTADLALSGRTQGGRVRGRLQAGFRAPDAMRLEGLPPFGPPVFILASLGTETTLLLPREDRFHSGTPARQLVEAMSGLALDAAALQSLVTGCVTLDARARDAARFSGGRVTVHTSDGTLLVARDGRVIGGVREGLRVDYTAFVGEFPSVVRVTSEGGGTIDLTLRVTGIETNRELGDDAFRVRVPEGARAMALDEVRRLGPLGDRP